MTVIAKKRRSSGVVQSKADKKKLRWLILCGGTIPECWHGRKDGVAVRMKRYGLLLAILGLFSFSALPVLYLPSGSGCIPYDYINGFEDHPPHMQYVLLLFGNTPTIVSEWIGPSQSIDFPKPPTFGWQVVVGMMRFVSNSLTIVFLALGGVCIRSNMNTARRYRLR